MALAGGLGLDLRLADVPRTAEVEDETAIAFCELLGRLLVEVAPENADRVRGCPGRPAGGGDRRSAGRRPNSDYRLGRAAGRRNHRGRGTHAWRGHLTS